MEQYPQDRPTFSNPKSEPLESQIKPKIIQPSTSEVKDYGDGSKLNLITETEAAKSGITYVVMSRDCSTVLKSPGTDEPYNTTSYKAAEDVAKSAKGVVVPLKEAIKLVLGNTKNW